jgi:hypothetical protein
MKPHFFILALLVVASLAAGPAAAQTNETAELPEWIDQEEIEQCQEPQAVDSSTVICSSTLTDDGQYAELVIRSDETQRITLTDAGGFMAGGEINRQTFTVRADEPNTLRLRVTTIDGFAGVSVDTGNTLYAVPLDRSTTLIGPPWSASDAQIAALFAAISTAGISAIVVLRSVYGKTEEPERIA